MPMIDIQRRHQTIFRIRFGEQVADSRSKTGFRPSKLTESIRVTSANPDVIDAFIDVYGGERKPWEAGFEAKLPTTSLNILVLPGQSVSQWWEKYRGSVCERRCDGAVESKSKKPCMCDPDVEKRTADRDQCSPTTRVSVICPDVAVVGSGMFVCHGLVGAETLPQSIAVAEAALSRGLMVPAVLRVVEFRGINHFIVPQIEVVGMSFNALTAAAERGQLQHATRELDAGTIDVEPNGNGGPRFTPVPPAALPPAKRLADQFGEFQQQADAKGEQRRGRVNAAVPIPATGVRPGGGAAPVSSGGSVGVTETLETDGPVTPVAAAQDVGESGSDANQRVSGERAPDDPADLVNDEGAQQIGRRCADAGIGDDSRQAFLYAFSGGSYYRAHDVPVAVLGELFATLAKVKRGDLVLLVPEVPGQEPRLCKPSEVDAPGISQSTLPPAPSIAWKVELGKVHGIGEMKLIRKARELGAADGYDPTLITNLDTIPEALNDALRNWLGEQAAA